MLWNTARKTRSVVGLRTGQKLLSLVCCSLAVEPCPPSSSSWKCVWMWRRLWMSWNSSGCNFLLRTQEKWVSTPVINIYQHLSQPLCVIVIEHFGLCFFAPLKYSDAFTMKYSVWQQQAYIHCFFFWISPLPALLINTHFSCPFPPSYTYLPVWPNWQICALNQLACLVSSLEAGDTLPFPRNSPALNRQAR